MAAKKPAAKKAVSKKAPVKKPAAKKAPAKYAQRADLGAPADGYFASQPAELAALLTPLRALVKRVVPGVHESMKWGRPFYEKDGSVCALTAFKGYVSITLFAPPELLVDAKGRLEGSGKSMRQLKVRKPTDIDAASIERWLSIAAKHAAA